jgi:hypothetical protein
MIEKRADSLLAFMEPETGLSDEELQRLTGDGEVKGIDARPVVSLKLTVRNKLNGEPVKGPIAFEVVPGGPRKVDCKCSIVREARISC